MDTTKDDEKSRNELDDNSKEIRSSRSSHQFITKENERIKKLSNSSTDSTEIRPPFPERLRKIDKGWN